jgi:hypothetical protein
MIGPPMPANGRWHVLQRGGLGIDRQNRRRRFCRRPVWSASAASRSPGAIGGSGAEAAGGSTPGILSPPATAHNRRMDQSVTFIGKIRIPDIAAWRPLIERMTAFVEANVPRVQSFRAYASDDGREGTVVYVHPDADSFDQHLAAAAELIELGTEMVQVIGIELLGAPHPETVARLRATGEPVDVRRLVVGFAREAGR